MNEQEFRQRRAQLIRAELQMPLQMFYLSFVNDGAFAGAVFIEAHGVTTAVEAAWRLGINPGGQVACVPCDIPILPELQNRLLSKDELTAAFGPTRPMFSETPKP